MKKVLFASILAGALLLSLAAPAFAGDNGSVRTGDGGCQVLANEKTDVGGLHTAHQNSPAVYGSQDCT